MQHVAKLASTRISEGHSAKEAIEERRTVLLQLWENVKVASGQRKASLARARELHTFNRDAAETKSRVQVCTYVRTCIVVSYRQSQFRSISSKICTGTRFGPCNKTKYL